MSSCAGSIALPCGVCRVAPSHPHKLLPAHLPLPATPLLQPGAMGVSELSEGLDLISLTTHNWHVQASCAITGEGLVEGLQWVAEELRRKEAAPQA